MERLTKRDKGGNARMDCDKCEIKYRESCCSTKLCRNALIDCLAAYEDAEERGLLIRLPCRIGERTFELRYNTDACAECEKYEQGWPGEPPECAAGFCVFPIENFENSKPICEKHYLEIIESTFRLQDKDEFGKIVFSTREEAEAALAKEG